MNRNTTIIGVVAALAIVGGVAGYQYLFGASARTPAYSAACGMPGCDWQGNVKPLKPGDSYPPVCPKCSKQSVLPLASCHKCGHKQVLNEELKSCIPGTEKLPGTTNCAKCGGRIVHGD